MTTREQIEAGGYEPICVPEHSQPDGCEHHDHLPGEPLDQPSRPVHVVRTRHIQALIRNGLSLAERVDGIPAGTLVSLEDHHRPGRPEALVDHALCKAISDLRHAADELDAERLSCFGWAQS